MSPPRLSLFSHPEVRPVHRRTGRKEATGASVPHPRVSGGGNQILHSRRPPPRTGPRQRRERDGKPPETGTEEDNTSRPRRGPLRGEGKCSLRGSGKGRRRRILSPPSLGVDTGRGTTGSGHRRLLSRRPPRVRRTATPAKTRVGRPRTPWGPEPDTLFHIDSQDPRRPPL